LHHDLATFPAPPLARRNRTLVIEQVKKLSVADAVRAALRADIDKLQFFPLDSIGDRLDAVEHKGLAAERGARRRQTLESTASLSMRAEPFQGRQ
jgi:hypothetical protein